MAAKANPKPCQKPEMELFPQVVTGVRGELGILPIIWDEAFCKNSQKLKLFTIFEKTSIFNVWYNTQGKVLNMPLNWLPKLRMFCF